MTTIQDRIIKDFRDKWTKAPDYHDPNTHQNYPAKYIERMSSLGFFVNMDEVEQFLIQSIKEVEEETRKEDKKECKHNWKLTPDTWGETCFYCGKQRKIKSTPSPLEIEEIETLKHRFMSGKNHCWRELSLQDQKINSLIRNQKKLYQFIKEKQK